jgi:hypothetical protein
LFFFLAFGFFFCSLFFKTNNQHGIFILDLQNIIPEKFGSLEMPVQVRVITVFTVFRLLTDFVCLYNYEFWLSLCKIVRSSVILLLPLLSNSPSSFRGEDWKVKSLQTTDIKWWQT